MQRILGLAVLSILFASFGCLSNARKNSIGEDTGSDTDPKILEKSAPAEASAATTVVCSVNGDRRTIEVRDKDAGCEVIYTKNGVEGVVATTVSDRSFCEQSANKIRNKLQGAGFHCK